MVAILDSTRAVGPFAAAAAGGGSRGTVMEPAKREARSAKQARPSGSLLLRAVKAMRDAVRGGAGDAGPGISAA